MQIISRRANEGIVIDGQTRVTVVEIENDGATLEIVGPNGQIERVRLQQTLAADGHEIEREVAEAVLC